MRARGLRGLTPWIAWLCERRVQPHRRWGRLEILDGNQVGLDGLPNLAEEIDRPKLVAVAADGNVRVDELRGGALRPGIRGNEDRMLLRERRRRPRVGLARHIEEHGLYRTLPILRPGPPKTNAPKRIASAPLQPWQLVAFERLGGERRLGFPASKPEQHAAARRAGLPAARDLVVVRPAALWAVGAIERVDPVQAQESRNIRVERHEQQRPLRANRRQRMARRGRRQLKRRRVCRGRRGDGILQQLHPPDERLELRLVSVDRARTIGRVTVAQPVFEPRDAFVHGRNQREVGQRLMPALVPAHVVQRQVTQLHERSELHRQGDAGDVQTAHLDDTTRRRQHRGRRNQRRTGEGTQLDRR